MIGSAVHRCLNIAEVQRIIVTFTSVGFGANAALAALALTCKAFHDAAEDALWESQSGIFNLLKCFPGHLWEGSGNYIVRP